MRCHSGGYGNGGPDAYVPVCYSSGELLRNHAWPHSATVSTFKKIVAGAYAIQLFLVMPWFLGAIYRHEQSLAVWDSFRFRYSGTVRETQLYAFTFIFCSTPPFSLFRFTFFRHGHARGLAPTPTKLSEIAFSSPAGSPLHSSCLPIRLWSSSAIYPPTIGAHC